MELRFWIDMSHPDAKALVAGVKTQGYETGNGRNVNERFVQILGEQQVVQALEVLFQQGYLSEEGKAGLTDRISSEPELRAKRDKSLREEQRRRQRGSDN